MDYLTFKSIEPIGLLATPTRPATFVLCMILLTWTISWYSLKPAKWASVAEDLRCYWKKQWELFTYPITAHTRIMGAYSQMAGKAIRINSPESWMTLVSSPELINDIKNATNEQLSLHAAAKEILKPKYTMNGFNWHDQRGIEGTRTIIDKTFSESVKPGKGSVNVLTLCKKLVTNISAYAFFGLDYVGDDDFVNAAYYYNEDVLYGSELIRVTPKFLVPVVGLIIPAFLKRQQIFFHGLVSIIEERMKDTNSARKHNDVIQWIINTSPKSKPWTPGRMAFEVMAIWFGSVQGLATTLSFVIFSLCSHPEYIRPLREEIEGPQGSRFLIEGGGLPLMDSFLKECSRWTPVESVTARRCALKDFAFSDGTRVAKGEWVGIPVGGILQDDLYYPESKTFNGFRFVDPSVLGESKSVQPEGPSKFTDVSDTWHVWGIGKLTCPGRFFVSYVMKHVIFHVLENYDPEMAGVECKNTINWRTLTLPAYNVRADFKPRT